MFRLNRQDFLDLYDITIKCENNQELRAHKCILVARLEYFRLMFSHNWSEVIFFILKTFFFLILKCFCFC